MPSPHFINHSGGTMQDISWSFEENKKYKYHAILHHHPTGMSIEQANERGWAEAKDACLKVLKWRLANWKEYQKSRVRPLPIDE